MLRVRNDYTMSFPMVLIRDDHGDSIVVLNPLLTSVMLPQDRVDLENLILERAEALPRAAAVASAALRLVV